MHNNQVSSHIDWETRFKHRAGYGVSPEHDRIGFARSERIWLRNQRAGLDVNSGDGEEPIKVNCR